MINHKLVKLKVSVITAVLNRENTIGNTLCSVHEQTYRNIEHIVIDGGSKDETLSIIRRHYVDRLVSEPDKGIADAMNKGIKIASGSFIIFLHADDTFAGKDALKNAIEKIDDLRTIYAFDIQFGNQISIKRHSARGFNHWIMFKNPIPHQGVLCPTLIYKDLGGFSTDYNICMDYDFWVRAWLLGIHLKHKHIILANVGDDGISSKKDWISLKNRFNEERRIHFAYDKSNIMRIIYRIYWPIYLTYRWIRCKSNVS